jgi:mannosylglycerate hydrolase
MTTLHLVPHTHWDREWYLPFQVFRLKLVHLLDLLADTLDADPAFTAFTLDGQTILLEDYLSLRPERRAAIEQWVRQGRVLIGPWYLLPDEFLVSPEALVRNLLAGKEDCARFGGRMDVGYTPDPFGHIGQLPQILRGFGIDSSAFRRGLDEEPCELWWEAPDGSRVLTAYLRDGYDNAARLPTTGPAFAAAIAARRDSLTPHCATSHRLLLNGTDHQEPQPELPTLVAKAWTEADTLVLSTLPRYLEGVRAEVEAGRAIPTIRGEARSPRRHHLLPAVLSSRTWIKQRNHLCETLLQRWVEPFSAWAGLLAAPLPDRAVFTGRLETPRIREVQPIVRSTWRMLLQCQPHDSICGCSIDAVHDEMRSRFDQVEEIGQELTRQSLQSLADQVDTRSNAPDGSLAALVVFNPIGGAARQPLESEFDLPAGLSDFEIVDADGRPVPFRTLRRFDKSLADMELDADGLRGMLPMVQDGRVLGLAVQAVAVVPRPGGALVDVVLAENAEPNPDALQAAEAQVAALLADGSRSAFRLLVRLASRARIIWAPPQIPAHGHRAFWLRSAIPTAAESSKDAERRIENEDLIVEAEGDGTLHLTDKRSRRTYSGLMRFSDRGERGDSYTHCPLEGDAPIEAPAVAPHVERLREATGEILIVRLEYRLPERLTDDRTSRTGGPCALPITARAHLAPGVPRLDLEIELDNQAQDHRLQVLFPTGAATPEGMWDAAFQLLPRPTAPPEGGADWIEQPVPEMPMRDFVSNRRRDGLMVAARGLREGCVSPDGVIAVTLLRCFGWLSRDDMATRRGGAGPQVETPGGQERGRHRFEMSLIPFTGDLSTAVPLADSFQAGLRAEVTPLHAGCLPSSGSLLQIEPATLRLSAVKAAEDGRGVIVRLVNPLPDAATASIRTHLPLQRAALVRLDETAERDIATGDHACTQIPIGPYKARTLRLELNMT